MKVEERLFCSICLRGESSKHRANQENFNILQAIREQLIKFEIQKVWKKLCSKSITKIEVYLLKKNEAAPKLGYSFRDSTGLKIIFWKKKNSFNYITDK